MLHTEQLALSLGGPAVTVGDASFGGGDSAVLETRCWGGSGGSGGGGGCIAIVGPVP